MQLDYKTEIDVPNIVEIISETFDGVLNLMTPNSMVFGGAIRDIIAGFGLHGDLDIVIPQNETDLFLYTLKTSTKWTEKCIIESYKQFVKVKKDEPVGVVSPHKTVEEIEDGPRFFFGGRQETKYKKYFNDIMIKTFINSINQKLQIIIPKGDLFSSSKATPATITKNVDFICCGLTMDVNGTVYEVVKDASDDCKKKILRINPDGDIKLSLLNDRINKLTSRGWISEININKVKQSLYRKRNKEKLKKKRNEINNLEFSKIVFKTTSVSSTVDQIDIELPKSYHDSDKAVELFYKIANHYRIVLPIGMNPVYLQNYNRLKITISKDRTDKIVAALSNYHKDIKTNIPGRSISTEHANSTLLPKYEYSTYDFASMGQELTNYRLMGKKYKFTDCKSVEEKLPSLSTRPDSSTKSKVTNCKPVEKKLSNLSMEYGASMERKIMDYKTMGKQLLNIKWSKWTDSEAAPSDEAKLTNRKNASETNILKDKTVEAKPTNKENVSEGWSFKGKISEARIKGGT